MYRASDDKYATAVFEKHYKMSLISVSPTKELITKSSSRGRS
jgi:hypothetical protein